LKIVAESLIEQFGQMICHPERFCEAPEKSFFSNFAMRACDLCRESEVLSCRPPRDAGNLSVAGMKPFSAIAVVIFPAVAWCQQPPPLAVLLDRLDAYAKQY
jgi:hypothetical protein